MSILFLPRLDYSFMGSFENMDNAFMSYIGFLYWEAHHTNPVAICFCELLRRSLKYRRKFKLTNKNEIRKKEQHIFGDWVECRFVVVAVAQQIVSLLPNMVLFSASLLL